MGVLVHTDIQPDATWWISAPELKPGAAFETITPTHGIWPLNRPLLLVQADGMPAALVRLHEFRTSPDGSVLRGVVLRRYSDPERYALHELMAFIQTVYST